VATFALRGPTSPLIAAQFLAEQCICAYAGNFYALPVTEALGLESVGGLLRVGAVHYNTGEEIHRLWGALDHLAANSAK
jgi:selenocysteine lyase/cysteine desulfurase